MTAPAITITTTATPGPMSPALAALRRALIAADGPERSRQLSAALTQAIPGAARALSRCDGPLSTLLRARPDCDTTAHTDRMALRRHGIAEELLRAHHRALLSAPHTMLALAAGAPNPVHGQERRSLSAPLARRLVIEGCHDDEFTVRSLTYAVSAALCAALHV
jgi:hypothetical protein